jgi:hypothetical protein
LHFTDLDSPPDAGHLMFYSPLVWADCRRYIRAFGAEIDRRRKGDAKVKIPKAIEAAETARFRPIPRLQVS